MKRWLLFWLLLPVTAVAQWGAPGTRTDTVPVRHPRVAFDLLDFQGPSPDSTRVDLYFAVPYPSLQFLYAIDKYVADYSVNIHISSGDTTVLDRYAAFTVLERIAEHHEAELSGLARADAEQLSFRLAPRTGYTMHVTVRDFYSRREFDTTFTFAVRAFGPSGPALSDLLLYRERHGMNVVPSIGPDVSSLERESGSPLLESSGGMFAELYRPPAQAQLGIVAEVFPSNEAANEAGTTFPRTALVIGSSPSPETAHAASEPLFIPLDFTPLWNGHYTVHAYVLPSAADTNVSDTAVLARRAIAQAERSIVVTMSHGIPILGNSLDEAIAQLLLIANSPEADSLSNARTPREKENAILAFWADKRFASARSAGIGGRAGNRAMEIFYQRVAYADANFPTSYGPGWKSDRGRVYIALGPPSTMDRETEAFASSYGSPQVPYEIWEYADLHLRYTFVDDYLLGDYRIRGAPPPEGTFVWE